MISSTISVWLRFAVCVFLIAIGGVKLSRYGDAIADKTGWGGPWIGLVLLGIVTSLPELATGISSVTVARTPEIAVGDILGSCVFNLAIIVVLDFLLSGESIYRRASQGHILAAGFGIMLIGFAGFSLLLAHNGTVLNIFHIGAYGPLMVVIYAIAIRTVFHYETEQISRFTNAAPDRYPGLSLQTTMLRYLGAALVVVAAGTWLPFVAKEIAYQMSWHESFVGTLFVAVATSTPELVVTTAAFQLGALDMAIGNLFGSNLFNILILVIDYLFYLPGPLLADVSPNHVVSALSAIMMTGVAIVGLLYRSATPVFRTVGWTSILLFCIYLLNFYVLYLSA